MLDLKTKCCPRPSASGNILSSGPTYHMLPSSPVNNCIICIATKFSDKVCISFTDVDVIYYCLHLNFYTLISCIATCLKTPLAFPVTSLYCKSLKHR